MPSEIKLYNMDCMEAMKVMPDKSFDLAIVDPPYGIGDFSMKTGSGRKYEEKDIYRYSWNDSIPPPEYFLELNRVSNHRIIWGANYYNCFERGAIVWFKSTAHPNLSKCEIASCTHHKKVEYVDLIWQNITKENMEPRIHPCHKPIKLYKWLLKNYAKPGDKILDTHLGSGSIAIACYDMGYDLTGYEIDKEYFDAATKRLENHKKQLTFL
jgi:site-specific DNA-methyltransferase (adenine-specific)